MENIKQKLRTTYRWRSAGKPDNSDGICPLNELLFMWLKAKLEPESLWSLQMRSIKDGQKNKDTWHLQMFNAC
jgi:hypothetical protein